MGHRTGKGRILEATREIRQGELVLVDKAVVVVPSDKPVCLGCLRNLQLPIDNVKNGACSIENTICSECNFPMCGKDDCDKNKWHSRYECAALKTADAANKLFNNATRDNDRECQESGLSPAIRMNQFYHVIAILRLILIQQDCSGVVKEQIQMLMDHNESR